MRKIPVLLFLVGALLSVSCALPRGMLRAEETPLDFEEKALLALIQELREQCPIREKVAISIGEIKMAAWGWTRWNEKLDRFEIRINYRQSMRDILDIMVHEWAHMMAWDATEGKEYRGHGPLWGVSYARCYRAKLAVFNELVDEDDDDVDDDDGD